MSWGQLGCCVQVSHFPCQAVSLYDPVTEPGTSQNPGRSKLALKHQNWQHAMPQGVTLGSRPELIPRDTGQHVDPAHANNVGRLMTRTRLSDARLDAFST